MKKNEMEITRQICKIFKVQIHELAKSLCKKFPHKQNSYSLGISKKQQLPRQQLSTKTYIVKQGQLLGRNTNTQPKCFKGVRLSVKFPNLRWDEFFDRRKQICLNFYAKNSMNFIVTLSCPKGSMIISYKLMVIVIRQPESYM